MSTAPDSNVPELTQLRLERSLYLRLLQLSSQTELDPLLHQALELIVEVSGAKKGYLEIVEDAGDPKGRWWIAHDCGSDKLAEIRTLCSRGIIAESLAKGRTIVTSNAMLDPRFRQRDSVRQGGIEAVLCAPIQAGPALGVVYLQGRQIPGPFGEDDRERVELFATHLAPLADRLLLHDRRRRDTDPTLPFRARMQLDEIVGRSAAMARVFQDLEAMTRVDSPVLLSGEHRTGKARLARVIHDNSDRSDAVFVTLDPAGRSAQEIEEDLFGFSGGADGTTDGKLAATCGGTLFIREITQVPLPVQQKLAARLRDLGGKAAAGDRSVRLLASTHADFERGVEAGTQCDDLFAIPAAKIRIPSLRERRGDVSEFAKHFCAMACRHHGLVDLHLSEGALTVLEATEWLGNISELGQVVEAGALAAAAQGVLEVQATHLFATSQPSLSGSASDSDGDAVTFQESMRRYQRDFIERRLNESGWNVSECARRMDIARSHLNARIKAFGIKRAPRS